MQKTLRFDNSFFIKRREKMDLAFFSNARVVRYERNKSSDATMLNRYPGPVGKYWLHLDISDNIHIQFAPAGIFILYKENKLTIFTKRPNSADVARAALFCGYLRRRLCLPYVNKYVPAAGKVLAMFKYPPFFPGAVNCSNLPPRTFIFVVKSSIYL